MNDVVFVMNMVVMLSCVMSSFVVVGFMVWVILMLIELSDVVFGIRCVGIMFEVMVCVVGICIVVVVFKMKVNVSSVVGVRFLLLESKVSVREVFNWMI